SEAVSRARAPYLHPFHRRWTVRSPQRMKTAGQAVRWAREELNLRPLPCQQNPRNRCATRRSPRSGPTVEAEGKRSRGVQVNALIRHYDAAAGARAADLRRSQGIA